jgi:hypothetical protein
MMLAIEGCTEVLSSNLSPAARSIFSAGISALYASPFTEAKGLGALSQSYSDFPEKVLIDSHASVMQCRHQLYSHRDQTATGTRHNAVPVNLHAIRVFVPFSGETLLDTPDIKWKNSAFEQMKRLCEFQLARLDKQFREVFHELSKHANKPPGIYSLGEDYP